jgi:hypothetical protein
MPTSADNIMEIDFHWRIRFSMANKEDNHLSEYEKLEKDFTEELCIELNMPIREVRPEIPCSN